MVHRTAALACCVRIQADDRILALRRQLAAEIKRSLGPGSQHVIAPSYGIPQPRMSELERGLVDRCTIEWLIRRIYRLGGSVAIHVTLGDVRREWVSGRFRSQRSRGRPRYPTSVETAEETTD